MEDFKLQSIYDGRSISITPAVARLSKVIRDMLEAQAAGDDIYPTNKKEIVIKVGTRGENLEKVIEWCERHKYDVINDEEEERKYGDTRKSFTEDIPSWDMDFFEANVQALMELYASANKLNIKVMKNYAGNFFMDLLIRKGLGYCKQTFNVNVNPANYHYRNDRAE